MAVLYREAPNQAAQLLEVISKAGLLSRQLGASWEEIAYASVLTSRQMGVAPTEMTTAMARFAMRVPESLAPRTIQQLAQLDDPAMIRRMGPSGLGIVTQRGGTQAQVMVEMIRNLNQAMEDGIEPGEAFADLLQSVADTPTEAFATAKASMAAAWTTFIASFDEAVGLTEVLTRRFLRLAEDMQNLASGGLDAWWTGYRERQPKTKWQRYQESLEPELPGSQVREGAPFTGLDEAGQPIRRPLDPYAYPRRRETFAPFISDWEYEMRGDPLKYIGGLRQYGDLSQEEFGERIGERKPEFMQMIESALQLTPGTEVERGEMRARIFEGFRAGGGITGFQGGEIGLTSGMDEAIAKWMQSAYPEELRATPFKTLGDVTEAEFMRMLPRAQEWEREAEDVFGREFEEIKMDVAFEDSFKELTISQETLAKTMELLNDTMTGMWNIPAGQVPMIPMPGAGLDIVGAGTRGSGTGAIAEEQAAGYTTGEEPARRLAPWVPRIFRRGLPGFQRIMEDEEEGRKVARPQHRMPMAIEEDRKVARPQRRMPATAAERISGYMDRMRQEALQGQSVPFFGGPSGRAPQGGGKSNIIVNVTAYLKVDGRQIVTQVERIMIQDARVTGRSIS